MERAFSASSKAIREGFKFNVVVDSDGVGVDEEPSELAASDEQWLSRVLEVEVGDDLQSKTPWLVQAYQQ